VAPDICITRDNIAVEVDGILYLQVLYRSIIWHRQLQVCLYPDCPDYNEKCYRKVETEIPSRRGINVTIVEAVDKASEPWGVKVTRYEVKNTDLKA